MALQWLNLLLDSIVQVCGTVFREYNYKQLRDSLPSGPVHLPDCFQLLETGLLIIFLNNEQESPTVSTFP